MLNMGRLRGSRKVLILIVILAVGIEVPLIDSLIFILGTV
jgi:hypothetical protein